ncbi:unnamed protein product [Allacma fusca]|uniref:Uncharacterized protein n=1 Tax=Allacma fusca TaxID=39272 RepID=A0A8J2L6Z2_9HEXA|nr:unnamed protein product [Allacma fusca]
MGNSVSKKAIKAPPVERVLAQPDLPHGTSHLNAGNTANELNIYGTQLVYVGSSSSKPKVPRELYKFPPRSPYFHGSEEKLKEIQEAIKICQEGETSYERYLVIAGLGGMENGVFGIEKYLEPELHCKKPIFVITCRDPTPFEQENITCLPALEPLTPEESYNCLIQHLDLIPEHAKKLPKTVQKAVEKLAELVEGHPFGLSLIGNAIAKAKQATLEEKKLKGRRKSVLGLPANQKKSFDDIKSDVKRCIDALTNDPSLTKSYK